MSNDSTGSLMAELQAWVAAAGAGARLPSTRSLVATHQVSPVTVQKAVHALVAQGIIETRPGVGTFVCQRRAVKAVDYQWQTSALGPTKRGGLTPQSALRAVAPGVIEFHSGYPEEALLPVSLVRSGLKKMMREELSRRPAGAGLPELRSWFATELGRFMPADVRPPARDDVVIVPGSQSGLSAVFGAIVGPDEPLIVESPTYWGALSAARQAQIELIPVASGPDGPDPEEVAEAFRRYGARAFYAQPNFANPTGATWSAKVRRQVLEVAEQAGAFIVEDDWAHEFGIDVDSVPLASLDRHGHVVYVRSLTKSVGPSVRVAAVIARGPAFERILAESQAESLYVSGVLQAVAYDVVTAPAWKTHIRRVRTQLTDRRDSLQRALIDHAPELISVSTPKGGLNLWVRTPSDIDPQELLDRSEAAGVSIGGCRDWFPAEPPANYTRLNFSGPAPERFDEGVRVLASTISELRGSR